MAVTEGAETTPRFRRWAGVGLLSAVMSRRVWTSTDGGWRKTFPNQFISLVGRPGTGKNVAINAATRFVRPHEAVHDKKGGAPTQGSVTIGPNATTMEKMLRILGDTFHEGYEEGQVSAYFPIPEFATLGAGRQSLQWFQQMADIWDNPEGAWKYQTKHNQDDFIHTPYLTMVIGVQPAWLAEGMPPGSWHTGYPARVLWVWGTPAEVPPANDFERPPTAVAAEQALTAAVNRIVAVRGMWDWAPDAKAQFKAWSTERFPPVPTNPLLGDYVTRRKQHHIKLALICAVSAHPQEPIIRLDDLTRAHDMLVELETVMPLAVMAAGGNPYRMKMEEAVGFVREKGPEAVEEGDLREFLGQTTPYNVVVGLVDELLAQRRIVDTSGAGNPGKRKFKVRERT